MERLRAGAVQHVAAGRHRLNRVGERRVRLQAGQRGGVGLRERRVGARHFKFRAVDEAFHRRRVVVRNDDRDREGAVRVADDRRRRHRRRAGVDKPDFATNRGERAALLPPLRRDPRGSGRAVAQTHFVHVSAEPAASFILPIRRLQRTSYRKVIVCDIGSDKAAGKRPLGNEVAVEVERVTRVRRPDAVEAMPLVGAAFGDRHAFGASTPRLRGVGEFVRIGAIDS